MVTTYDYNFLVNSVLAFFSKTCSEVTPTSNISEKPATSTGLVVGAVVAVLALVMVTIIVVVVVIVLQR